MSASRLSRFSRLFTLTTVGALGFTPSVLAGCGGHSTGADPGGGTTRVTGQTDFVSAPMPGQSTSFGVSNGATDGAGSSSSGGGTAPVAGAPSGTSSAASPTRAVQETDIYRLDGNRLYYLNEYRGLMIFDVSDVDHPKLIGRAPIFGDPQEMLINANVAVVVVGDWYGVGEDGSPFHGSIVRGYDCTDPANIKVVGESQLGGYVQDTRVVGNVLYTVAQDYGWEYGWEYGWGGYGYYGGGGGVATPVASGGAVGSSAGSTSTGPRVVVASVSFANRVVKKVGEQSFDGYAGVFYVTPSAIMLGRQAGDQTGYSGSPGQTSLQYVDISDPAGAIKLRGSITVNGAVSGWGPDNGRWNLDFQDGIHAHTLGCAYTYCGDPNDTYVLSTVDFTNPDAPVESSELPITSLGWSAAARFDGGRMYLSPSVYYSSNATTPLYVYDLADPKAPKLAGQVSLTGDIWMFIPNDQTGSQTLFALGDTYSTTGNSSEQVQVQYVDVSDAIHPKVLNAAAFGAQWSWSPAAETFKAFTVDDTRGLAVVPFSGWSQGAEQYVNGMQLLQFDGTSLTAAGAARTKGWVERGIFVNDRLVSLSDQALSVVDYTNPALPKVVTEMTLARNVVNAQPQGDTIAELSSDWWGYDQSATEMRVLPIANASETTDNGQGVSVNIDGFDANVFTNGTLQYVVSTVQTQGPCPYYPGSPAPTGTCTVYTQQVQVVDTTNGTAVLRGKVNLPNLPYYYGGWGWEGFWYYDWYNGADAVQVGKDALAFRRWYPQWSYGPNGYYQYDDSLDALFVVDLANPDQPKIASLTVTDDATTWWGNMMAVGDTLYTTHFEWESKPAPGDPSGTVYYVRYYLDQVDLTDRANPKIGAKVNSPGILVGASTEDPTVLYFADYRWDEGTQNERNDLSVAKLDGGKLHLQSITEVDGWVGNVIVQNDKAYMTAQQYSWELDGTTPPFTELHQIDFTNPKAPVDRVTTDRKAPFGWLLGVQGDRAIVTSGWGPVGVDIYQLGDAAPPKFSQSVRALGWGANAITRQNDTLFMSSGYWGVQTIPLK